MNIKKILILVLALTAVLAVAAFGTNGLQDLLNTKVSQAQAAGDLAPAQPGSLTLTSTGVLTGSLPAPMLVEFLAAPELPVRAPDAVGVFGGLEGDILTLNNGPLAISVGEGGLVGEIGAVQVFTGAVSAEGVVITGLPGEPLPPGMLVYTGAAPLDANGGVAFGVTLDANGQPILLDPAQAGSVVAVSGSGVITGNVTGALPEITLMGPEGYAVGQAQIISGTLPALPGEMSGSIVVGPALPLAAPQAVQITAETIIYKDVTPMLFEPLTEAMTIQQTLEPGSLDELSAMTLVTVWGHYEGEQLVADIIVYQTPPLP